MQVLLLSEDLGKHLMGVEDLIQKHALLEADVAGYGDRVSTVNHQASKFMDPKGPDGSGGCSSQPAQGVSAVKIQKNAMISII